MTILSKYLGKLKWSNPDYNPTFTKVRMNPNGKYAYGRVTKYESILGLCRTWWFPYSLYQFSSPYYQLICFPLAILGSDE